MFETLSSRLGGVLKGLRNRGRITEQDVAEVLAQVRIALLEADVNIAVVSEVVERIRVKAVDAIVAAALNPGQQIIKVVNEELVAMLGGQALKIGYASQPPTVVLLAGLQGSGKTTTAAKLAGWFKSQGRQPLLVGSDLQRPAAVEQLRVLGATLGIPVFSEPGDPVETAAKGLAQAKSLGRDVLIVDTAGRLAIDKLMIEQVTNISAAIKPNYTFLVVDAMTGQDAVTVAKTFDTALSIDAVILSKLDGDARGGAALSVKHVLGKPIAFAGIGEALSAFELFHPDRMASRILGMGDMLTLIEQAEKVFEKEQAEQTANKMLQGAFTLDDFLEQLQQLKKMGPLQGIMGMMPNVPKELKNAEISESQVRRTEAIIHSMTARERANPELITGSHRVRISRGSGTTIADVNRLVKQFLEMKKMIKQMSTKRQSR